MPGKVKAASKKSIGFIMGLVKCVFFTIHLP